VNWDCHVHVFGPPERFPLAPARRYTPALADVAALRRHLAVVGAERVVLVQPTVYGDDHRCLLDALDELGEAAVAVAACPEPGGEPPVHPRIRALRLDLRGSLTPEGERRLQQALAGAAAAGLHVELQVAPETLPALGRALAGSPVPVALDHMAGLSPGGDPGFVEALLRLLQRPDIFVKLSALERLPGGVAAALPLAAMIAARAPGRLLWGSDWPHTPLHPAPAARLEALPFRIVDDADTLAQARAVLEPAIIEAARRDTPARLYGR
jgi:predicted TIM-barrel fold metal-dependent hydrolase